jgi:anionic cell wall polymer biosynthesis LytR-Cps2A-Psr (LCP) family protein
LGLTTQYYVLIDMQGFVQLIDALGGIDIDVQERIPIEGGEDANGQPINVAGWIEPGEQHLDGYHALWYARARHGTNDYDRMARQREVQEAVLRQMDPANVLLRFNEVAAAGGDAVSTDIPAPMLSHFVDLALKAKELPLAKMDFVPEEWDNVHPDVAGIQAVVDQMTAPVTPSPTP